MKLSGKLAEAFAFALEAHGEQRRKGTDIPYLSHPMAVAALVLEHGGGEAQAIGALLHDVVEDCGVSFEQIKKRFGPAVARIVKDCTDSTSKPKPPWRKRKERAIEHARTAPPDSLLVSAADKLHNARAIVRDAERLGEDAWARFNARPEDILWYYESMLGVFQDRRGALPPGFGELVDELAAAVEVMAKLVGPKGRGSPGTAYSFRHDD